MLAKLYFLFQSFFPPRFLTSTLQLFGGQQIFLSLVWHLTILGTLFWFLEMFPLWNLKLWQIASTNLTLCEGEVIKLFSCLQVTPWWHCTFLALVLPLEANGSSRSALQQLCCSTSKENTSIGVTTMQTQQKSQHHKHTNWIQHCVFYAEVSWHFHSLLLFVLSKREEFTNIVPIMK